MADLPMHSWREMTTAEIAGADTARWIAVLPVVASETRAPHLPLSVDGIVNAGILERALELAPAGLPVTVLPALAGLPALGGLPGDGDHPGLPGTLALAAETLERMGIEIGQSVRRAGIGKLVLFGGQDEGEGVVEAVARELRAAGGMLAVTASWRSFGLPGGLSPEAGEGAMESAMLRALAPAPDAGVPDSGRGRRLLEHAAGCLVERLGEVGRMAPEPGAAA